MDFGWLYTNFPLEAAEAEGESFVTSELRRATTRPVMAAMPLPEPVPTARSTVSARVGIEEQEPPGLPEIPPFGAEEYDAMIRFIHVAISKWNTWNYRNK
jgi:hypothetical protein